MRAPPTDVEPTDGRSVEPLTCGLLCSQFPQSPHRTTGGWKLTILVLAVLQLQDWMQGSKQAQNYDTREYDVLRALVGAWASAATSTCALFRPAFLNGLGNFSDDYNTLEEHHA